MLLTPRPWYSQPCPTSSGSSHGYCTHCTRSQIIRTCTCLLNPRKMSETKILANFMELCTHANYQLSSSFREVKTKTYCLYQPVAEQPQSRGMQDQTRRSHGSHEPLAPGPRHLLASCSLCGCAESPDVLHRCVCEGGLEHINSRNIHHHSFHPL